ncbi:MAG: hypothetical protein ABIH67_01265 [Candidatus Uhrbacteria bacterium]
MSSKERPSMDLRDSSKQELSPEERRALGSVWSEIVLGSDGAFIEDASVLSDEELREQLNSSLISETKSLLGEWGLTPDIDLIKQISEIEDDDEKAKLELRYLKQVHEAIDQRVRNFDRSKPKSTKWDSWPDRMRETGEFNCVGAITIGSSLLEQAGLESYIGNPPSHVLNIVRLSNGDWWYVDFMNGKNAMQKIDPMEREVNGHRVLQIEHPSIDYRLIPISPQKELPSYVLGNLASLQKDASEAQLGETDLEKKEAFEYANRHRDRLTVVDLSELDSKLFNKGNHVNDSEEMRAEANRVDVLWERDDKIKELSKDLDVEQLSRIAIEISGNLSEVRQYLFGEVDEILPAIGQELKIFLESYRTKFSDLAENQREEYQHMTDRLLKRITGS